jgi:hypothetical protein
MTEKVDDIFLNDIWSVYFHSISNPSWTMDSYVRMGNMNTVREFLSYRDATQGYITHGMFFIMREHVFPCWDDPYNINGETISIKILKDHVADAWTQLATHMVGEVFFGPGKGASSTEINGISISPKKSFCIVKIWMKTPGLIRSLGDAVGLPLDYTGELVCTANSESIKNNNK